LSFRPKVHHLMERFKSQFRVVGDVESDLRRAGFPSRREGRGPRG
jgi:hypothetical protein